MVTYQLKVIKKMELQKLELLNIELSTHFYKFEEHNEKFKHKK
jgi:hypothetical protein